MPIVDVYAIVWNEESLLPYFLRHYGLFAERIIIFDNHSCDKSREIALSNSKVELRSFGWSPDVCGEVERMAIRETAWKESVGRADWVIVADCDEFLWHPDLLSYLDVCKQRKITIPKPVGYEMVSSTFPTVQGQIYDEVRRGLRTILMDKWLIFDPQAIRQMQFGPGCHNASPTGITIFDNDPELKLLHFKHLGFDYAVSRYQKLEQRRTANDRYLGLNRHYTTSPEAHTSWLKVALSEATDVI